jgi:hypothetical protein
MARKTRNTTMADKTKETADFTQSDEFKAAVSAEAAKLAGEIARSEVRAAVDNIQAEVAAALKTGAAAGGGVSEELFSRFTLAIAELTDQGAGLGRPVRVAPEVMHKRAKAFEKAVALIKDAREGLKAALELPDGDRRKASLIEAHRPHYAVMSPVYLNERLIAPWSRGPNRDAVRTEIYWTGLPSDGLRPLNRIAEEIFTAYREWVGLPQHIANATPTRGWLTDSGLFVVGDPPVSASKHNLVQSIVPFTEDLAVSGDKANVPFGGAFQSPDAEFVQVLGTTAAGRARQNVKDPLLAGRERGV